MTPPQRGRQLTNFGGFLNPFAIGAAVLRYLRKIKLTLFTRTFTLRLFTRNFALTLENHFALTLFAREYDATLYARLED
jgi:hypothetical protein